MDFAEGIDSVLLNSGLIGALTLFFGVQILEFEFEKSHNDSVVVGNR